MAIEGLSFARLESERLQPDPEYWERIRSNSGKLLPLSLDAVNEGRANIHMVQESLRRGSIGEVEARLLTASFQDVYEFPRELSFPGLVLATIGIGSAIILAGNAFYNPVIKTVMNYLGGYF